MHDIADILTSFGIIGNSTTRNININILTICTMTLITTAITSMLSIDMTLKLQMQQRPIIVVTTQVNTSTLTTIATIWSAIRVILHMTKVHGTSTTLTRAAVYLYIINKITFHL